MNGWRNALLDSFIPGVSRLTLVSDPDGLMAEEELSAELHRLGFEIIEFTDTIEFRYEYESRCTESPDGDTPADIIAVLRSPQSSLDALPYDLLKAGRRLSFSLGELFPALSSPVIQQLDRNLLDRVHDGVCRLQPERMGDNATMDFILRHVFGITAELTEDSASLLHALLHLHYGNIRLPLVPAQRLVQLIKAAGRFDLWPLDEIVPDGEAFFGFLQEQWAVFVNMECSGNAGDIPLPFLHKDIAVYLDNLFLEGKLKPVELPEAHFRQLAEKSPLFSFGITSAESDSPELRISRLLELLEKELPSEESRHTDWLSFAMKLAELSSLTANSDEFRGSGTALRFRNLQSESDTVFWKWLCRHYASLISLPPAHPTMPHHVARRLAREMENSENTKVALIVVDGLALDQWVTMRKILGQRDKSLIMRESALFAWIPTLTSISRQSIFSGKTPIFFPSSIGTTNSEGKLWRKFWEEHGLSHSEIIYMRGLGDGDARDALDAAIHPAKTRAVGLVVDKVDKIMHGMQLGSAGMHNQVSQWCRDGFIGDLTAHLLDCGYKVWLTSDHGNIECTGRGQPSEGAVAETRGERVRIYPTTELRSRIAKSFTWGREWQPVGLPPGFFPLIAGDRDAFIREGGTAVAHGGAAVEEVIVPFVKFERRRSHE